MKSTNITGIVIAGGKSSRMGSDKGMVELKGKKFIEYILDALKPKVDKIIIIANNDHYDYLGFDVYGDLIRERGPLGGIYTGLMKSETEKNFIVSCDIPFITGELVGYLAQMAGNYDVVVPLFKDRAEPLCGVYSKEIAGKLFALIGKNELRVRRILHLFNTRLVPVTNELEFYNDSLLANINTPLELQQQEELSYEH